MTNKPLASRHCWLKVRIKWMQAQLYFKLHKKQSGVNHLGLWNVAEANNWHDVFMVGTIQTWVPTQLVSKSGDGHIWNVTALMGETLPQRGIRARARAGLGQTGISVTWHLSNPRSEVRWSHPKDPTLISNRDTAKRLEIRSSTWPFRVRV